MPQTISTLLISDLHERGPREKEPWRRRRVLGDAWLRNLDEALIDGPCDIVCFTSDLADWGIDEEYAAICDFFELILTRLALPRERLFVVPGNHDINRRAAVEAWTQTR